MDVVTPIFPAELILRNLGNVFTWPEAFIMEWRWNASPSVLRHSRHSLNSDIAGLDCKCTRSLRKVFKKTKQTKKNPQDNKES